MFFCNLTQAGRWLAAACSAMLALTACNRPDWQRWQQEGVFSVEIPQGRHDITNVTLELTGQDSLEMTQLTANAGEVSFSVAYTGKLHYSAQQMQQKAQAVLLSMQLRTEGSSAKGEPELNRPFRQWQSLLGREIEVTGAVYQKGGRIVRAVCSGPTGQELDRQCHRFLDSLTIE